MERLVSYIYTSRYALSINYFCRIFTAIKWKYYSIFARGWNMGETTEYYLFRLHGSDSDSGRKSRPGSRTGSGVQ